MYDKADDYNTIYSKQDLEYAAEVRNGVHKEALEKIRRIYPGAQSVVDRYAVENYFQEHWDYPGKWYTIVAIPYGFHSRDALVDAIVRDTLDQIRGAQAGLKPTDNAWMPPESDIVFRNDRYMLCKTLDTCYLFAGREKYMLTCSPDAPCLYITDAHGDKTAVHNAFDTNDVCRRFYTGGTVTSATGFEYDAKDFCKMVDYAAGMGDIGIEKAEETFGDRPKKKADAARFRKKTNAAPEANRCPDDPFYEQIAAYPDCAVDYCIVTGDPLTYRGCESHWQALSLACRKLLAPDKWQYDVNKARGKRIDAEALFTSAYPKDVLNYRKAFLYPPHENHYTGVDFVKVNAALFPNGTDGLEAYEWSTDWSDYFDEGHEWWGTLCCTVYDKSTDRFAVILASATD